MSNRTIQGMDLEQTSGACPEQYEVFLDGKQVGYLRLRHGFFRTDYPHCGGTTVYERSCQGDGVFASEVERVTELSNAIAALWIAVRKDRFRDW